MASEKIETLMNKFGILLNIE